MHSIKSVFCSFLRPQILFRFIQSRLSSLWTLSVLRLLCFWLACSLPLFFLVLLSPPLCLWCFITNLFLSPSSERQHMKFKCFKRRLYNIFFPKQPGNVVGDEKKFSCCKSLLTTEAGYEALMRQAKQIAQEVIFKKQKLDGNKAQIHLAKNMV